MILVYLRHGEPIYDPDSLTENGKLQAEALSKRLSRLKVNRIFSSPSNRALQTAIPTSKRLNKEIEILDFMDEKYVWEELTLKDNNRIRWLFQDEDARLLLQKGNILYNKEWYKEEEFKDYHFDKGFNRVNIETDKFLESLGYLHERENNRYKIIKKNDDINLIFAHQGFGMAFLSSMLDIAYPYLSTHIDISHSSMTVIYFKECKGYSIPKILTLSNDSHLYKEELSTLYNHEIEL